LFRPACYTDRMIDTGNFVRFERVDSVETTDHGLDARLHGEHLRIELVADDIVRVKISRGGVFDEAPTFAVCVDPLATRVEFRV
jgi:alpha-glucosidase